jgi:tetratricopeptide (TPR) repeat protein
MICKTGFMILAITGILAVIIGCAPEARKVGGYKDDPGAHYKQGMKYWDDARYQPAEEEFNFAKSLDPKYAPAYSGLALITAKKAQDVTDSMNRNNGFKEALELADKAQSLNPRLPLVFVAKAYVITLKYEGNLTGNWLNDVENEYSKAINLDPDNSESIYRRGVCHMKAYEFTKAGDDFQKVLDLNREFVIKAKVQWELIQIIERTPPGTDAGKKIAITENISRADVAALFVSELQIDKILAKKTPRTSDSGLIKVLPVSQETEAINIEPAPIITDISSHWAKRSINTIVVFNIRGQEPYPDNTFHPDHLVNRGEFALSIEDALIAITGDKSLATKYISNESKFFDVNPAHPSYNAICNAVDKGLFSLDSTGAFGVEKMVSGPEALEIIGKLKALGK